MDIFNFFASRDLDLEATILAGKELEVALILNVENAVVAVEETSTNDVDEVMEETRTTDVHGIKSPLLAMPILTSLKQQIC